MTPVLAEGALRVDGRLDEADWARAAVVGGMVTLDETLDGSLPVAFEKDYGTAAWAGYTESWGLAEGEARERSVFAKASFLWRP